VAGVVTSVPEAELLEEVEVEYPDVAGIWLERLLVVIGILIGPRLCVAVTTPWLLAKMTSVRVAEPPVGALDRVVVE